MKGAEAVLRRTKVIGIPALVKERIAKTYRAWQLDVSLRKQRTRAEARLLHRAKLARVRCPVVLEVNEFSLTISYIRGKRPKESVKTAKEMGTLLAKLHAVDIAHGDFTPANLIFNSKGLYVIDFGLGFFSQDIEDKAIDVYTMLKSLKEEKSRKAFLYGYQSYTKHFAVIKRLEGIKSRIRYAF